MPQDIQQSFARKGAWSCQAARAWRVENRALSSHGVRQRKRPRALQALKGCAAQCVLGESGGKSLRARAARWRTWLVVNAAALHGRSGCPTCLCILQRRARRALSPGRGEGELHTFYKCGPGAPSPRGWGAGGRGSEAGGGGRGVGGRGRARAPLARPPTSRPTPPHPIHTTRHPMHAQGGLPGAGGGGQ